MRRTLSVERDGIDKAARTVELSFASESPVDRWFGREILDITPQAVDLARLQNGGAVLVNHNWDDQVGVITEARIDPATKKARAKVKFSRSARGEEIFNDITDGIRSLVSVGYIVRKMVLQSVEGDMETHRVTDWQPYEVSIVAVPADASVGVGRGQTQTEPVRSPNPSSPMSATPAAPAAPSVAVVHDFTAERQRVKDLNAAASAIAQKNPQHADALRALAARCAESGDTLDHFNRAVLADVLTESRVATPASQVAGELGLDRGEQKRYSLLRAIALHLAGKPLDGIEGAASRAEAKRIGRDPAGFFVPAEIFANRGQRTMQVSPASDGGYNVANEIDYANMVELLRNQSHVMQLGARVITGLTGDVSIPRVLTGSTVYWVSETGTISKTSATWGQLALKPRRIGASVDYTRQFLAQSGISPEQFIRDDVMGAMGVELDRVAINGAGAAEPLGILNLAAGDRATSVTFGAAATWAKVLEFETNVATSNALGLPGSPYAYLTTPATRGKWKAAPKVAATSNFLWEAGDLVNGYAARATNQFPTAGTLNQVIFGQFGQVIYGEWAGIDIIVDPYTGARSNTVGVTIQKHVDMIVRQPKAFAISADSGAQ